MWSIQKGSQDIVVGTVDTGIDYTHPDLAANMWVNVNEIRGNGIDDDKNGYADDIHGINAIKNIGNPLDDNSHGTHVAGTIGAVGNNNLGVVGVLQSVQIIGCKFLTSYGSGNTSNAIKCMDYFLALKTRSNHPVNLIATNNSWGGGPSSQAMLDAIKAHHNAGILFIAAAGNDRSDNDVSDIFPANYDAANVISVAATDHNDRLASFSNYGKKKVHVAAPGTKIVSTILGHKYGELSGTSMAAPYVTGLAAIIAAQNRNLDAMGIRNLIITSGQPLEPLENKIASGRRIRGADINGVGALTCNDQGLVIKKSPSAATARLDLGKQLFLSAQHLNCASFGGPITLYEGGLGSVILEDSGLNGDLQAEDGIYSLDWKPTKAGDYELKFSADETVLVTVVN
jgi:subtilisin family serine protease